MTDPILILGGGNMGSALALNWHEAGMGPVHVIERDPARISILRERGLTVHSSLANAPHGTLVLAIKPQQFAETKAEIQAYTAEGGVVISIMAGVTLAALGEISAHAVRVMPNLPALVGEGMSVLCAPTATPATRTLVTQLFEKVGRCAWIEDEGLMQVSTALSGCGPGYVYAFMEALEAAGIAHGLDAATARQLVMQTLRGAAILASESEESFTTLREQVTSPGGVTQAALGVLYAAGFTNTVHDVVGAAIQRSKELAE